MTDLLDYIFRFPDAGAAQRDQVVGPYFANGAGLNEVLIYQNGDSVDAASGYWPMVSIAGPINSALANHPNIELINNRSLQIAGAPSVVAAKFDVTATIIIANALGAYACSGLRLIP
jgi:hypothetical protein